MFDSIMAGKSSHFCLIYNKGDLNMDNNEKKLKLYKIEHLEIDSFFDCMSDLLLKLTNGKLYKSNDFDKHFSQFMVCRYLSMSKHLLPYAEYLNTVQTTLDKKSFYQLAYSLIPKQKTSFIRYIKKPKKAKEIETSEQTYQYNDLFEL